MFRLPVSQLEITVRQPAGGEDLLLLESAEGGVNLAMALIRRVTRTADGGRVDAATLAVTDLEAILLLIRREVFGDLVRTDAWCQAEACRARFDISFRISEFLAHQRVQRPKWVEAAAEPGWFRLTQGAAEFRVPCAQDLADAAGAARPDCELMERCVRPAKLPAALERRVERALESMAPGLSQEMRAQCPECGAGMEVYFDVSQFVLRELRDQAAYIYRDIHLLASNYHWPEAKILNLPRNRRLQYAEMLAQAGGLG